MIAIEGVECAGELVVALTSHADRLKQLYKELHALVDQGIDDDVRYQRQVHGAERLV